MFCTIELMFPPIAQKVGVGNRGHFFRKAATCIVTPAGIHLFGPKTLFSYIYSDHSNDRGGCLGFRFGIHFLLLHLDQLGEHISMGMIRSICWARRKEGPTQRRNSSILVKADTSFSVCMCSIWASTRSYTMPQACHCGHSSVTYLAVGLLRVPKPDFSRSWK